jgi:hypothetical protein
MWILCPRNGLGKSAENRPSFVTLGEKIWGQKVKFRASGGVEIATFWHGGEQKADFRRNFGQESDIMS